MFRKKLFSFLLASCALLGLAGGKAFAGSSTNCESKPLARLHLNVNFNAFGPCCYPHPYYFGPYCYPYPPCYPYPYAYPPPCWVW